MTNKILVSTEFQKDFSGVSEAQRTQLAEAIKSLSENPSGNNEVISHDDTSGGGLRMMQVGDMRLFFRYIPEKDTVLISDLTVEPL